MSLSFPRWAGHIDRIYRAALEPEHWPGFLEPLARELQATTLHLSFRLPGPGDPGVIVSVGMDDAYEEAYRTHFHLLDPWMPHLGKAREREVRNLEEFVPERDLERTEFYNVWMRPQGIFHGFGAFLRKSGPSQLVSSLSGFRDQSRGPFETQELELIRPLIPHLQRALLIHSRVQAAELSARATEEALNRITGGLIVLDDKGAPLASNRTAEEILRRGDGLSLGADGPRAASEKETRALQRAVAGAAQTGAGKGQEPGAFMRLSRPSGLAPLETVVAPIRLEASPLACRRAAAAIFVSEPEARVPLPAERLRRLYGLTAMEARIACRLAEGTRLSEIGEALGVSIHTVRGHLKQIFAKTHTHRQADLVRLLVGGPARLRLD